MNNEVVPSLSDISAVVGNRNNGGFGFGGDGAWIVLLLLLALGNNGNGFFGNGGNSGATDNYVLASDFATLQRQLDSATNSIERKGDYIQEQICNSDQMNSQLFATVNSNLMNGFANTNLGISNNRYETQLAVGNAQNSVNQNINSLSSQFADCCCQQKILSLQNTNAIQSDLAGINYNLAANTNGITNAINNGFCQTNYNNATNTRDIIDNANANFRALHDEIVANRIEDKNQEIAQLRTMLNNANLAASQAAQTNQIISTLEPKVPTAAYVVPNPFTGTNYNSCNCGYNF